MRYIDEFICQYEKNYYELPHDGYVKYMEVFIQKLPSPFNITLPKLFKENIEKIVSDSFGGMIRTLREYIRTLCIQSQEIKRVKRTFEFNCENYEDIPQKFGCEWQRKHKKRKYKKYYKNENKYFRPRRRKWYKIEKGKNYYKEKEKKAMDNEKYFPQGKKNCKCCLCHEICHYANECPNKKSYKKEVKYLNQINSIGLVPIESLNHHIVMKYYLPQNPKVNIVVQMNPNSAHSFKYK